MIARPELRVQRGFIDHVSAYGVELSASNLEGVLVGHELERCLSEGAGRAHHTFVGEARRRRRRPLPRMRWNLKWKTRKEKPPAWCDPACFGGVVADENALVRIDRRKRSFKKTRLAFDSPAMLLLMSQ